MHRGDRVDVDLRPREQPERSRASRCRRAVVGGLVAGAVLLVALALLTGWQALKARAALEDVARHVAAAGDAFAAGNYREAHDHVDAAARSAAQAQTNTHGPVWYTATKPPWIGD